MLIDIDPIRMVDYANTDTLYKILECVNDKIKMLKLFKENNPIKEGESELNYAKRMRTLYPSLRFNIFLNAYRL